MFVLLLSVLMFRIYFENWKRAMVKVSKWLQTLLVSVLNSWGPATSGNWKDREVDSGRPPSARTYLFPTLFEKLQTLDRGSEWLRYGKRQKRH